MSVCDCSDDALTADEVHASVQKYHRGYEPIFDSGFTSIFSRFPQSLASQWRHQTLRLPPGHNNGCASCGYHACHIDSLIVAISGTARLTAAGNTESGYGVYFGHQNPHNIQRHVDEEDGVRPSAQREAIRAAIAGLDAVMPFCGGGGQWDCSGHPDEPPCMVKHVILKSDSAYLVETVGGGQNGEEPHMRKWLKNGFKTASKQPVKNKDLWDVLVAKLTGLFDWGVAVEFWLVSREENEKAAALASAGCA
uniref:Ribonuclease n=1 Tax=Colletotrichum fructicola (strain Nara gc5) TaxID=1213859 RepID=L2GC18_COLFN